MSRNTLHKCKACGADIVWIRMAKSGKPIPCNAEPFTYDRPDFQNGKLTFITPNGKMVRANYSPNGRYVGYISHFNTCTNIGGYKKENRKDAEE